MNNNTTNLQLAKWDKAKQAISEAKSVDEVKDIMDRAVALQLYARQMNDIEAEVWIAEIKARAMRRFGELSSKLESYSTKSLPTDGKSLQKSEVLKQAGVSTSTANRCEKVAKVSEKKFEEVIKKATEKKKPVTVNDIVNDATHKVHISQNSGENEWYTPPEIIEKARKTMGSIDTDPASSDKANKIVKSSVYFTIEDNGLEQDWIGNIWMNPPYSQPDIRKFCEHLIESEHVIQACVLVNNATETRWFQMLLNESDCVCFLKGRVKFIDEKEKPMGAPLQGQAILYFGENIDKFKANFKDLGVILKRYE